MIVDCAHYRDGVRQNEGTLPLDVAEKCVVGDGDFVWLGLFEPTVEELRDVGARFDLHELALEDAYGAHQRPKLEDYDDSWFIVLRPARYDDAKEEVEFGEIMLFVSRTYVIAVRHGEASQLTGVRKHLEAHPELLEAGPAAAVWAIVDKIVDDYSPVVEGIDNDISEVETEIFDDAADSTERIYFLKREVIEFHEATGPLLAPAGVARARRLSRTWTSSCAATSATSPTTPAASTSRSAPSASCSPRSSRRTSPCSASARTTSSARSPRSRR